MVKISATESQRLTHINSKMDGFYVKLSEIYEALVDRDYASIEGVVKSMVTELESLSTSTKNQI